MIAALALAEWRETRRALFASAALFLPLLALAASFTRLGPLLASLVAAAAFPTLGWAAGARRAPGSRGRLRALDPSLPLSSLAAGSALAGAATLGAAFLGAAPALLVAAARGGLGPSRLLGLALVLLGHFVLAQGAGFLASLVDEGEGTPPAAWAAGLWLLATVAPPFARGFDPFSLAWAAFRGGAGSRGIVAPAFECLAGLALAAAGLRLAALRRRRAS